MWIYFRSCWAEHWKLHHAQSSAVRLYSPKPAEMAKGNSFANENCFFLATISMMSMKMIQKIFSKQAFPRHWNIQGWAHLYRWAELLPQACETLPPPHHVPTLWADEQPLGPTAPQIQFLTPERGDVLSLPSWFVFHLISLILAFCRVERDSEGAELWDVMP